MIVTYPTFTEDGKKEIVCSICGDKNEETITKLENKFDDLKSDEWYAKPVAFALYEEIMHGMSDTSFAPNGNTTRAQLVQVLYNLEGGPDVDELTTPFTDLEKDWYQKAVKWAYNNEIVYGTTETTFGPDDSLTREQFAAFLYRYAKFKGYDVSGQADMSKFTDFDKAETYAEPALKWANDAGLITGHANTTLIDPKGPATRAQMASILYRVATTEFEMAEPDEGAE